MKALRGQSDVDLRKIDETPSTVYVPQHMVSGMESLLRKRGLCLRGLLGVMLANFEGGVYGEFRASRKGKRLYQQRGLNLERRNFHPTNGDWAALMNHAHSLGYAGNLFFVKLLYLELKRMGIIKIGLPRKIFGTINKGARRLKRLCSVEVLEFGRHLTRKFAHGP